MATLDYSKTFDSTSAEFGIDALSRAGFLREFATVLAAAWHQQQRWIEIAGRTTDHPLSDAGCLPQGCPASPLALAFLLR